MIWPFLVKPSLTITTTFNKSNMHLQTFTWHVKIIWPSLILIPNLFQWRGIIFYALPIKFYNSWIRSISRSHRLWHGAYTRSCLMCLLYESYLKSMAKEPVQVSAILRSQNGSDERGLVVGCSLSLTVSLSPITAYLWTFSSLLSLNAFRHNYHLEQISFTSLLHRTKSYLFSPRHNKFFISPYHYSSSPQILKKNYAELFPFKNETTYIEKS